jgi:tetratricopeptide (TPR) repeat protein
MKYSVVIASTISMMLWASTSVAKPSAEIEQIARAATVEIKLQNSTASGSGVIIHYSGDIYTVVTNKHVVCGDFKECTQLPSNNAYRISTADGSNYLLNVSDVTLLGDNLDLAIMQFQTKKKYTPAQIELSKNLQANDTVYTAGFPAKKNGFVFHKGNVLAVTTKRLMSDKGGYTIIYKALADLNKSIQLEGRSGSYQERGNLRLNNFNDVNGALEDFNKSIELSPDSAASYGNRALLKMSRIGDANGALADLNKAINIDPELALAYNNRAVLKYTKFNDSDGALDDISKAIMLNPNLSLPYVTRGGLKASKKDPSGALADINQAIKLNPTLSIAYSLRGGLKADILNDTSGGFIDLEKAIELDPKSPEAYFARGFLKNKNLNDRAGAIQDFERAIQLSTEQSKLPLLQILREQLKQLTAMELQN